MQNIAFASVGAKGMFTREIEDALLAETIDLAVHSLKDLPTELGEAFTLAAIPQRADPRDVLVSERYGGFDALPAGAVVGTSSLRRQAQLRARRPDLEYIEFRGNVDTRLAKLGQGKADAIILAAAGLERLQKTRRHPRTVCARGAMPRAGPGSAGHRVQGGGRGNTRGLAAARGPGHSYGHHRRTEMPGRSGRRVPGAHRRLLSP